MWFWRLCLDVTPLKFVTHGAELVPPALRPFLLCLCFTPSKMRAVALYGPLSALKKAQRGARQVMDSPPNRVRGRGFLISSAYPSVSFVSFSCVCACVRLGHKCGQRAQCETQRLEGEQYWGWRETDGDSLLCQPRSFVLLLPPSPLSFPSLSIVALGFQRGRELGTYYMLAVRCCCSA